MKYNDNQYFQLYANCILVKGYKRSTICDLQFGRYLIIPNLLTRILKTLKKYPILKTVKKYPEEIIGINQYLELLINESWGFITETPLNFPPLQKVWDHPSIITNAILDYNTNSNYSILNTVKKLDSVNCEALQIRIYSPVTKMFLQDISNQLLKSEFTFVELYIEYNIEIIEFIRGIALEHTTINKVVYYNSQEEYENEIKDENHYFLKEIFIKQQIIDETCCGVVRPEYFTPNISFYTESSLHNSCLNRKIGVDVNGKIKNCPSSKEYFGYIDEIADIRDIIDDNFKKSWNITKDQIDVCKVCEYRTMCPDCRVYITNPVNSKSKPSKCNYNPYTNVWE